MELRSPYKEQKLGNLKASNRIDKLWEFPGSLVVRLPGFHCGSWGSVPGRGTELTQAVWPGQKNKNKKRIDKLLLSIE